MTVLFGPSGAGKSTLAQQAAEARPGLTLSQSWTTRPRRLQEPPQSYNFVSEAEFLEHRQADGFLEWDCYLDNFYGTPVPSGDIGEELMLVLTLDGAMKLKELFPETKLIYIDVPSTKEQKNRLKSRDSTRKDTKQRIRQDKEIRRKCLQAADHHVINDDLVEALSAVLTILDGHQQSTSSS